MKLNAKSILISLAVLSAMVVTYLLAIDVNNSEEQSNLTYLFAIPTILLIIVGNYLLDRVLDMFLEWKEYSTLRFFTQMIVSTFYSIACINITYRYVKHYFTEAPALPEQINTLNVFGTLIILPAISVFFGIKFLRAWRKSEIESERLQKENVRSQMMTLRNHLDPHFLFNNLNTVSSLIDHDAELSKTYLDKFAEVYRIILRTESSDLTTVEDEMKLIESYLYLLKIRFQDRVNFEVNISKEDMDKAILPLSIQMLIENAIKHNRFSKKEPINIVIRSTGKDHLCVENNLQIKKYDEKKRSGTGLKNIKERYKFFTEKELKIITTEDHFTVKVPLLEIDYN